MTGRLRCCVPYCRRTTKPGRYREWICSVHWPMVSKRTKARKRLSRRYIRREVSRNPRMAEYWKMTPGSAPRIKAVRMYGLAGLIWERCKREAIEAATGII